MLIVLLLLVLLRLSLVWDIMYPFVQSMTDSSTLFRPISEKWNLKRVDRRVLYAWNKSCLARPIRMEEKLSGETYTHQRKERRVRKEGPSRLISILTFVRFEKLGRF
ncbi:hypothetical protein RND81_10G132000 [Saponaria officinalis]|uniref:Secreted protein n=1 Tax=Saponaria officinalis TaxID=3572 RepID=A0AAW1I2J3_SAPOF